MSYEAIKETKPFTPRVELRWVPDENKDLFPLLASLFNSIPPSVASNL
jgi:hypothetical protein